MATTEQIRAAILSLSEEERASLLRWLVEVDKLAWDREIERDFSPKGPGALLLEQIKKDYRTVHCRKWE